MGMHLQTVASFTPFLISDLGLSYSEIGLLIGLFLAPGVVLAVPGSLLVARLGHLPVGVVGLVLMATGSICLSFVDTFWQAAGSRLIAGTGGILLNISFLRLTARLYQGAAMNRAISIVMSSWPVGLGLGAVAYPVIADLWSWRGALWVVAGITAVSALCAVLLVPEPERPSRSETPPVLSAISLRSWYLSLSLGASFACFTAGGIIYLSFAPTYFEGLGMGLAGAGAAASMIVWLGLIGTPLGAWIADKFDATRSVILVGAILSALLVVPVLFGEDPMLIGIILGIIWGLPAAPYTGLLQRMLPPTDQALGYGIYFLLFYSGFFLFPFAAGWILDATGTLASPLWFAAFLMLISAGLILVFYGFLRMGQGAQQRS
jgi:predicted MFS family arabinose efflux permease